MEITNRLGLHLRAASQFVELARQFQAEIRLSCNGRAADGRSILDLMMLAAEYGTPLELEVNGPEAAEATAALCALIEARFREDEEGGASTLVLDSPDGAFHPPRRRNGEEGSGGTLS
jgi:phosphocarrier protein